jgi:hypothetical protein
MNAYWIPGSFIAIGLLLLVVFHSAPRYTDPEWRKRVPEMDSEAFYREQERSLTLESKFHDAGLGMIALGISSVLALTLLRVKSLRDFCHIQTPRRLWVLFIQANVTWLAFAAVEIHWLFYTARRGDYPWWADSIGIPVGGIAIFTIVGLPVMNLGLLACTWRSSLPTNLWIAPRGVWAWTATATIFVLGLFSLLAVVEALLAGHALQIPLLLSVVYLLLCGRAAAAKAWFNKRLEPIPAQP